MNQRLMLLLLAAAVVIAYSPALRGGFVWDDDMYVVSNGSLRSVHGLIGIWKGHSENAQRLGALNDGDDPNAPAHPKYNDYPLALTTYWFEYQLFGLRPFPYHLSNLLLHVLNCMLLYRLVRQLGIAGAPMIAAVFALHPLHVESVAWVAERKTLLCSAFSFAAMMFWVRHMRTELWRDYAAALGTAVLAMFSKSSMVILPGVLLLLSWWQGPRHWRRALLRLWPLLLAAAAVAVLTILREHRGTSFAYVEESGLLARLLIAGRGVWFYAGKLLWPFPLMAIYPRWTIDPAAAWQYAFPLAAVALLAALFLGRYRFGKGPFTAVAIYVLALLPTLGLVSFDFLRFSYVADHFAYPATAALIALGVAALARFETSPAFGRAAKPLAFALVAGLGFLSFGQAEAYQSAEAFWAHTARHNPAATVASVNLAREFFLRGRAAESEAVARTGLAYQPQSIELRLLLGAALGLQQKLAQAEAEFRTALTLDPQSAAAHINLGLVLFRQQRWRESIEQLSLVPQGDEKRLIVARHLGLAYGELGDTQNAVTQFKLALTIDPQDQRAREELQKLEGKAGSR